MADVETHPIRLTCCYGHGEAPTAVTLAAYEVYAHVYGAQEAMITGSCRGGFSVGELVAFLYARSFQRHEWRARVNEALTGMRMVRRG